MPDYGVPTEYQTGMPLAFPDLTLEFLGERHTSSPMFPPGFRHLDFRIARADEETLLSWSSGTGVIAPHKFGFRQQAYYLELVASLELGWLAGNQVVIWQALPFEERLRARDFL